MNDKLTSRLLSSVITALEGTLVPEPKSEHSAIMLDIVIRTLRLLQAQFGARAEDLKKLVAESDLLVRSSLLQPQPARDTAAPNATDGLSRERLEAEKNLLNEQLADCIPGLLEKAAGEGQHAQDAVNLLSKIVSTQIDFLSAQDPDILNGSTVVYRGGRIDRSQGHAPKAPPPPISENTLTSYLRGKLPDAAKISVNAVKILPGGFSKTTVIFEYSRPGQQAQRCVIRKDLSADFLMMGKSAVDEYPLLEKLYAAGLKVARPLWLEQDKSVFNGSFFVSEAVSGTSDIQKWIESTGSVSKQLAQILAQLHRYTLSELQLADDNVQMSAGLAMQQEIAYWQALYEKRRTARHPLLEIGLAWVQQNIPAELFDQPACVVHGDVGFHNLMVLDGQITALLDWEFSHLGAPAEDLIYVRPFVEQIADWEEFLKVYRSAGGRAYSKEVQAFFNVWSFVRNAAGTRDAGYLFENHLPDEIKLALPAWIFGHYLEVDASKMVLGMISNRN